MAKRGLAGVMNVDFFDINKNLVFTAKTLTDSGLNVAVSADGVRGGDNNKLLYNYYFDSALTMTLTDATFDLNYLASKFGSDITMGSDVQITETITTTTLNQITVTQTPVAFPGSTTIVGAYKLASDVGDTWTTITFSAKTATVASLPVGSVVCVKYFYTDSSARNFKVSSSIVPKILYAVAKVNEYNAGMDGTVNTSSSVIGQLQVIIPSFQLDPNLDLALTSGGHASTAIGGSALNVSGGTCANGGYYAILNETTVGGDPFATCTAIGVKDGDITMTGAGKTETIQVYGFYSDGTAPSPIPNSLLTFVSGTTATATVNSAGLVTSVATGTSTISVTVTAKPALSTKAVVTVS